MCLPNYFNNYFLIDRCC